MGSVGENGMVVDSNQIGVFASYLIRIKPWIESKYLIYILQSSLYWNQIYSNKKGTTRSNINANTLRELVIPIPPLEEQQRIVDKIESLFEKLDKTKELIEEARDNFEKRKSSILEKAFRGELTREWRKKNLKFESSIELESIRKNNNRNYKTIENSNLKFDIPKSWIWTELGELIDLLSDYHSNGSYKVLKEKVELLDESNYACMIRTTNFEKDNFTDLMKYITKDAYEYLEKSKLFGGEILINKIGNAGISIFYA